jgi:hypothetical protein
MQSFASKIYASGQILILQSFTPDQITLRPSTLATVDTQVRVDRV